MIKQQLKLLLVSTSALFVLAACGTPESSPSMPSPQAVPVDVAPVITRSLSQWSEFTGNTTAPENIQLTPRVSGYLSEVHFAEGSAIKKGELLFSIDAAPFLAEVQRLEAELAIAKSQKLLAEKEFNRAQRLSNERAISKEQLDSRFAVKEQAKARIDAVEAALLQAQLQLDYTQVTAPIDGVASSAFVTQGNFVQAGSTVLTTVVSNESLHAYFDANQSLYLQFAQSQKNTRDSGINLPVLVSLGDNGMAIDGKIDFIDNQINPDTGTIRARAVINNDSGILVPGMFTRLKVFSNSPEQRVLIDDKAIGTDLSNKFVLVLNPNNQVEYRAVTLGQQVNGLRIIETGLNGDEVIVVNGLQRVMPGAEVSPQTVSMAAQSTLDSISALQARVDTLRHQNALASSAYVAGISANQGE